MSTPSVPSEQSDAAPSPFHRLTDFLALPRLGGLALSADGTRLAVSVATLDAEKKKWQTAVWEVDPGGEKAARRLTRSAPGESSPARTLRARKRRVTPSRRCGASRPAAARPA